MDKNWYLAEVPKEITDRSNKLIIMFEEKEVIYVTEGLCRKGYPAWEVVNHSYRNGFIFGKGTLNILGEAFLVK